MTKLLIATCQPVLARGFEAIFVTAGFEVSVAYDVRELHTRFLGHPPEIAVLEYALLPGPGILDDLRKAAPRCRLLLLARHLPEPTRASLAELGVYGAVPPTVSPAELVELVKAIVSSGWSAASIAARLGHLLNATERRFVSLVAQGAQDREIAALMQCTERRVGSLRRQLSRRLEVEGRCELALYGLAAKDMEIAG